MFKLPLAALSNEPKLC